MRCRGFVEVDTLPALSVSTHPLARLPKVTVFILLDSTGHDTPTKIDHAVRWNLLGDMFG
jgi:hypothetical protein